MKTISFKMPKPATAEEWISGGVREQAPPPPVAPTERMKRFTIDVSPALHSRIKIECARRGLQMADVIRELLEAQFPKS